jgi:glycosyltransferase involved in cell wall biosynthesis
MLDDNRSCLDGGSAACSQPEETDAKQNAAAPGVFSAHDPDIQLMLPASDVADPQVTILVPCMNEEITIGGFVDWCKEGLAGLDVPGEILIVDSSTDQSPKIALAKGARVLKTPKRGLGRAYIDAIPYVRGKYVILGDSDMTYDFRQLRPFVDKMREGAEYVMGSRMKGYIEPGAMPALHRYFGTPLTTWILNFIYRSHYSDIHCGMRAMTLEALRRIDLQSQSWEYASEMVLKASKLRLRKTEVPIRFYKDPPGRLSHHKRAGWFSPWAAGWINLKAMFLYAPDFFLYKPGLAMLAVGWLLALALVGGPVALGSVHINLYGMLLGVTMATIGYSAVQLGILARVFYNFDPAYTRKMRHVLTYDRGVIASGVMIAVGLVLDLILLGQWIVGHMRLDALSYTGIFGLLLLICGFQTFTFTLIFEIMAAKAVAEDRKRSEEARS